MQHVVETAAGAREEALTRAWRYEQFLALGVATGLVAPRFVDRTTRYSHAAHVFVSALASLLYLVSFGLGLTVGTVGPVLLLLVAAVMLPCCLSDIVIPVAVVHAPPSERHRH